MTKNNKMLLLATKKKTNSYHIKKKKRRGEKSMDGKNEFQGVVHKESQDVWAAYR